MTEPAQQTPPETPPAAEAPPEPQVKVVEKVVERTVIDPSPIDASIATLRAAMETVDESQIPAIESQIAALESQKKDLATKADLAELEALRRKAFENDLAKELPDDINVSEFFPNLTNEDRLAAAKLVKSRSIPVTKEEDEEFERRVKEEASKRFGGNLVPDGTGVVSEEARKAELEAMKNGDLQTLVKGPTMKEKIKEWMNIATG